MLKLVTRGSLLFFTLLIATLIGRAQIPEPTPSYMGCSVTLQSWAVTNPELHCVCRSESQLPDCSNGTGSAAKIPTFTTKQMIQMDIASSVVDAFVNMLFSDNSKANAQKQQMLRELQMQQALADAKQHREEAMRLAAICQSLQSSLKLSGTTELELKMSDQDSSGLGLKLGDDDQPPPTSAPVRTHNPPPQNPPDGGLGLKFGDDTTPPPTTAAQSPPVPNAQAPLALDLSSMTPKQLADLFTSLPPDQQERILQAAKGRPPYQGSHTQIGPASAQTTTEALQSKSNGGSSTTSASSTTQQSNVGALGQLQHIATTSQAATHAATPEEASALASQGFDTASGTSSASAATTSSTSANVSQPSTESPVDLSHHSGNSSTLPVVDLSVLAAPPPLKSATTAPASGSPASASTPGKLKDCIPPTEHRLPSRDQLLAELATRRTELQNLQNVISRLNRNIQSDQKLFDEWQGEAQASYDRTVDRVLSLPSKLALDSLVEMKEEDYTELKNSVIFDEASQDFHVRGLTPAEEQQVRWLERAGNLKSFDDFQKLVLEEKSNSEAFEEGIRQLISFVPFSGEVQSYANCAEDLIDNMYDYVDLKNTWEIINTLDHNSDRYLLAVKSNGERMKALVERIRQIETQLNAVPPGTQLPYCLGAGAVAR